MSAPYLPTPAPWFYISGEVCADVDGKIVIARADREPENPIRPVERDANMRAIAELPSLIACLENLLTAVEGVLTEPQLDARRNDGRSIRDLISPARHALARALDKGGQS